MTPFLYLIEARELMCDLHRRALRRARHHQLRAHRRGLGRPARRLRALRRRAPRSCAGPARRRRQARSPKIRSFAIAWRAPAICRPRTLDRVGRAPVRMLRAGGVAYDVRRVHPYSCTASSISTCRSASIATTSTATWCAWQEMRQSRRMIAQCFDKIPDGPVNADDPRVRWPAQGPGVRPDGRADRPVQAGHRGRDGPPGEVYHAVEAPTANWAFISSATAPASRGSADAARRASPTCRRCEKMITGGQLADVVPTFGMINMIGGECDR